MKASKPKDKWGFRKGFSTTDNMFVLKSLIDRCMAIYTAVL